MSKKTALQNSGAGIIGLVLGCFFFSGMTGLIYEILWIRQIVKIIGGAPFAVSIILTVFMGGLGLGSYVASRTVDRVKEPLKLVRIYGILELAIGGYGLILPMLLIAFRPLYAVLYNRFFEHAMLYNLMTFAGCSLLLIIPVICMGATLPILCRFYVTRLSNLGSHVGRLYGLNTIGAAFGSLLCGFWLIANLGMAGTLAFVVIANGVIGLVSIVASYKMKIPNFTQPKSKPVVDQDVEEGQSSYKGVVVAALLVFAVSGFCSMAYEVIWTKLLGLIIGPTTYSFTIVLVTFITCLALGSMIFGWLGDKVKKPIWLLIYTQVAAAVLALLVSQLLGNSQFFFAKLIYHFQDNFALLNISKAAALFIFMLAPTLCLGATFPLVGKICTRSLTRVGKSLGTAYAINTIGAVLGSFCAGFLLVPLIGKENGLRLVFGIQMCTVLLITIWLVLINKQNKIRGITIAAPILLGLVLCFYFPDWNRKALSMGRYHRTEKITESIEKTGWFRALCQGPGILARQDIAEVVYYGDGIGGFTVILEKEDIFGNTDYSMVISGKPDASTSGDMATQTLSAHIPMIFHPNPKSVMVLGHASGITAGETLHYPVERLDILEISREVVKASRFFDPWNGNVLDDSRTELIVQDGRAHLQLTNRKYDVIISEPSNPWMAGLAALFTQDFFELARDGLNENGIFAQFIHSYQMDWSTFAMVGRTFANIFDKSALVNTRGGDYLMLGFKGGDGFQLANVKRNFEFARRSKNVKLLDPQLMYRFIITEDLKMLCGRGQINSDAWPILEYSAPKNMFINDVLIENNISTRKRFSSETSRIYNETITDIDGQIDLAALVFSVYSPFANMVDIDKATAEQKQRYFKIVEEYCSTRKIDYSMLSDEQLKSRCRKIQIEVLKNKLDTVDNKVMAYSSLADLYRQSKMYSDAEIYYTKTLGEIYSTKTLEFKQGYATIYNHLGAVLHYQGRLKEALANYDKAIELDPDHQGAQSNRQKVISQLRNTQKRQ